MKKAQIKMFETIAILIVFFFLFAFGLVFYIRHMGQTTRISLDEGFEYKSMDITQVVNNLPELQCSTENIVKENCYDKMKLEPANQIIGDNRPYYFNLFSYAYIWIEQIYPEPGDADIQEWIIYENPMIKYNEISRNSVPISIYDDTEKTYAMGILHVEVYR